MKNYFTLILVVIFTVSCTAQIRNFFKDEPYWHYRIYTDSARHIQITYPAYSNEESAVLKVYSHEGKKVLNCFLEKTDTICCLKELSLTDTNYYFSIIVNDRMEFTNRPDPYKTGTYKLYIENDEMYFSYKLFEGETGVLKISNHDGAVLRWCNLSSENTILDLKERDWMKGIYYYSVKINNRNVYSYRIGIN